MHAEEHVLQCSVARKYIITHGTVGLKVVARTTGKWLGLGCDLMVLRNCHSGHRLVGEVLRVTIQI